MFLFVILIQFLKLGNAQDECNCMECALNIQLLSQAMHDPTIWSLPKTHNARLKCPQRLSWHIIWYDNEYLLHFPCYELLILLDNYLLELQKLTVCRLMPKSGFFEVELWVSPFYNGVAHQTIAN